MKAFGYGVWAAVVAGCASPVWTPTSTGVEVSSFGYWQGSWRFQADRAELSSEQERLLGELVAMAPPAATCPQDIIGAHVTVSEGTKAHRYATNEEDAQCPQGSFVPDGYIRYASYAPLVASLGCRSARSWPDNPAPLTPSAGCRHGIFAAWTGTILSIPLDQQGGTGPFVMELEGCYDAISLSLLGPDGGTVATDTSVQGVRCARIERTFEADAGTFTLRVEKPASSTAGDFFLRYAASP